VWAEGRAKKGIRPVFVTEGCIEDPRAQKFRENIHRDFDGSVLRSDLPPLKEIPDRGPYSYAHIPLKENAEPQRQKPFRLQGERLEAHKVVTRDWADHWFIERPPKEQQMDWLSVTFVVPKKSKEFPWRGVVDMRGPNSQTRRVNFPLPKIEDLLVKQGKCQIFSIMDLKQAFHQQPLHPESRHIHMLLYPRRDFSVES